MSTTTPITSFGPKITDRKEILAAVHQAQQDGLIVTLHFKQSTTRPRPILRATVRRVADTTFTAECFLTSTICFDDIEAIEVGGPLISEVEREVSPLRSPRPGMPFHNGVCWQHDGEPVQKLGYCTNPVCFDRKASLVARADHGLPTGKYWGASIENLICDCGDHVTLT